MNEIPRHARSPRRESEERPDLGADDACRRVLSGVPGASPRARAPWYRLSVRLPADIDPTDFDERYRLDLPVWREAVSEVCAAHGLAAGEITAFADGSNLVAAIGEQLVVKIFPPFHRHQWESERRVLPRFSAARLPIPVPALHAEGERADGWTYVIVDRLGGAPLEACWPALDRDGKAALLLRIGETIAAAHALPVGDLASLPPAWSDFRGEQIARCRARHARLGMPSWLVDGVDDFVRAHGPRKDDDVDPVILTGEYTPFNLLAVPTGEGGGGARLTGMIDFGDAMIGPREYDLLGPSLFSCEGDPRLVAALFRGYGRVLDDALRHRLLALALLHRYASFDAQLRIRAWRDRASSLDALAELVWPLPT